MVVLICHCAHVHCSIFILFLCFRVSGYMMMDKLEVPRRKVRKDWYVGLHPDPVDRTHPDVHDDLLVKEAEAAQMKSKTGKLHLDLEKFMFFVVPINLCPLTCESSRSTSSLDFSYLMIFCRDFSYLTVSFILTCLFMTLSRFL